VAQHEPFRPTGATPKRPSEISRSVPQTPTASVRTSTSPSPARASGTCATCVEWALPGVVTSASIPAGQAAVSPPSMVSVVPVTKPAPSAAR
jgi:hypothetical protein